MANFAHYFRPTKVMRCKQRRMELRTAAGKYLFVLFVTKRSLALGTSY